jgi:predicted PurR-regulated permease PerM
VRDRRDDAGRDAPDADGVADPAPTTTQATVGAERLTVTVDPRSGIWIVAGILSLTLLAGFFDVTRRSMTIIGVGVLLAFALEPLVLAVQRRTGCGRGVAVGVVGTGLLVGFGVLAVVVGPAAVRQAQDFGEELPSTLTEIEGLPLVGPRLADADFATRVEDWVDGLPGRLDSDGVETAARTVLNGAVNGLGVLLVALVTLLDGPTLVARLRVAVPARHRERADTVGRVFYRVVGTYFAGSLLVASIGGTWVLVVGLVVGVPLAPVAAVWYAVVSLIPQIGGFLGTSFVTVLALTQGVVPALVVLVLVVAYMNLENYVITPAIVGEAVDLSPPVTMLAALVGGAAAGVPGALAATPLCGTVKALYMEARYGELPPSPGKVRDRLPPRVRTALARVRRVGRAGAGGGDDG